MLKRLLLVIIFCELSVGADVPGGLLRTAESLQTNHYEFLLSPQYLISEKGAHLSADLRYQVNDDFGTGFGFGSGEIGFNFGAFAHWYLLPELDNQPAFSIMGGLYFNRVEENQYLVVKTIPTMSKTFKFGWGTVQPYAGLALSPSFGFGVATSDFSMKTSMGSVFVVRALSGIKLWCEAGLNLSHSYNEVSLGVSYAFEALGR